MTIVANTYYEHLPDYVQVLFQLTVGAIKNDVEEVSHYAIEFWNTLCDEEESLAAAAEDAQREGQAPERECKHYVVSHIIIFYSAPDSIDLLFEHDS